ncbi:hypothetical protein N7522_011356 [Penicillium canescens]|uniref:Uncharacterized protein n=1 Tax=Penicillium canescens TaxID=5083 RepID=A0AAD6IM31_PENCN|nr:uncharacterized protein N7446_006952 [Penicillium canescens]KAJ5991149.1 hypothetical protein N7522_011356 [Penicillium canescens]KAJ6049720.1 hypothetical protein N7444_006436 [Penicillium canescens]KAJ6052310.1 hypothetical protein N7460_002844 [Penicillium canescens]KAJ6062832.1 hypothetical protein N7446_006952 [Penicillium canescens]
MWKSIISISQQASRATRSQLSTTAPALVTPTATKAPFSTTPGPQKSKYQGLQDRESLSPERSETTKSGTDAEVAEHPSAFDPSNTAPESELAATAEESKKEGQPDSPLDVSAANKDVSAWRHPTEGGPARNRDRETSSARGAPKKNRSVHVKEDGTHVSYKD